MNIGRLQQIHRKLIAAVIEAEDLELPAWRFDGKAVTTPEEVAYLLRIPLSEANARLELAQKDVWRGSDATTTTHGVGTVRHRRRAIVQRADALASGRRRRRRRHKRRSEQDDR